MVKPFLSQPVLRYRYRKLQHRKILKQKLWRTWCSRYHRSPKRKGMTDFTIAAYSKPRIASGEKPCPEVGACLRRAAGAEQVPGYYTADELFQRGCEVRWRGWVRAEILILRQCAETMKVKSIGQSDWPEPGGGQDESPGDGNKSDSAW